jgi:hypothetical protein
MDFRIDRLRGKALRQLNNKSEYLRRNFATFSNPGPLPNCGRSRF